MPDLNKYMGASGVVANLEGLRRDIRANAFEYLARVLDAQPLEEMVRVIQGNAQGYRMRILDVYMADRADPVLSGLMVQGLAADVSAPIAQYDGLAQQCLNVANAEAAAVIVSPDDVVAVAMATLLAVPLVY